MLTNWWRNWRKTRPAVRRAARRLPAVEQLEGRDLPAPIGGAVPVPVASLAYSNVNATPTITNAFVNDLYLDGVFRLPTADELNTLAASLNAGKTTGGGAFATVVGSADYKNLVSPVLSLYETYLGRPAELGGAAFWTNAQRQGFTLGQVAGMIYQAPEFAKASPSLVGGTNDAFVTNLYQAVFHRAAQPNEVSSWSGQLTAGKVQRGDVLAALVQAPEFAATHPQIANQNLVNIAYLDLWNRTPDAQFAGYVTGLGNGTIADATALGDQFIANAHYLGVGAARNYLLGVYEAALGHDADPQTYHALRDQILSQTVSDTAAFANVLQSVEYKYVTLPIAELYQVYLGRNPESGAMTYWDNIWKGSNSLAGVGGGIGQSPEFKANNGDLFSLSPAAFTDALYKKVLKRTESAAEQTYWVNRLNAGFDTKGSELVQFILAGEAQAGVNGDLVDTNTALFASRALLGHDPDAKSLPTIVAGLKSGSLKPADLVGTIMNGTEFATNSYDQNVGHQVVIYQENWSFDGLYGSFPGATGLSTAGNIAQVDKNGNPITTLPQPKNGTADNRFPPGNGQPALPVGPYDASKYVQPTDKTGDIVHRFYTEQQQIDGGKMDKFVTFSDNGGLVFSNFNATNLPEGQLAQQYTMDDMLFHSAFGGSFLNHQYLIAAAAPPWTQPLPTSSKTFVSNISDPNDPSFNDGNLTADGKFAVNTTFSVNIHPNGVAADQLMQNINDSDPTKPGYTPTIGDRLDKAGVAWKWYSGGWDNAVNGNPDPLFQFHHQAFAYYQNYASETVKGNAHPHLQDENNFFTDAAAGTLPAVSFIKPLGPDNEHPGYAALLQGQQHVQKLVSTLQNSSAWANTAIVITYDENGGRWDQVSPPTVDSWGPGTRVPGIVVSPFARRGFVDHTVYETDSILRTIEQTYNLQALGTHDANANSMVNSYTFSPSQLIKNNS
jgi:phospholipase C